MKRICSVLALLLLAGSGQGGEPVFIPIKIDGPVHDPAIGSYWYGPFNESCSLVDVNGDGLMDITCGVNWYEAPKWNKHRYYFEGAEQRPSVHIHCHELALDVNKDGLVDVVNSGYQPSIAGVVWYENPGRPGVKWKVHRVHRSERMEGLIKGDMDGDGDLDVLTNHFQPADVPGVVWLESIDKAPWLVERVLGPEGLDHGNGLGDINGDGRIDVVTPNGWYEGPANPPTDRWPFHRDYALPSLRVKTPFGTQSTCSHPMLVIDVNEDGRADIIVANGHGYGLYWLEQRLDRQGKRSFKLHTIERDYGCFHTMTLADVNADGELDLLTGKRLFGHDGKDPSEWDPLFMFWYEVKGGQFERHVISFNNLQYYPGGENVNAPPQFACGTGMKIIASDITADGKLDIVVAGRGGLYAFINRGMSPIPTDMHPKVPLIGEKRPDLK